MKFRHFTRHGDGDNMVNDERHWKVRLVESYVALTLEVLHLKFFQRSYLIISSLLRFKHKFGGKDMTRR